MAQIKASVVLQHSWILSQVGKNLVLPVPAIMNELKSKYSLNYQSSSAFDFVFLMDAEQYPGDEPLTELIVAFLRAQYDGEMVADVCKVRSEPWEEREHSPEDAPAESAPERWSSLDRIHRLIGADEFKMLAEECASMAPQVKKYGTQESFLSRCFLFSVGKGNGLTTCLNLFADLLRDSGLFDVSESHPVLEVKFPYSDGKDGRKPPSLSEMTSFKGNNIVSIDISEWMGHLNDPHFLRLLSEVDGTLGRSVFVFTVPYLERDVLNNIKEVLSDVLFVRDVSFVPLSLEELEESAKRALEERHFTLQAEVLDVFRARISAEKQDGRFYGFETVHKVVREMIYYKQLYNARNGLDDTEIRKEEILELVPNYGTEEECSMDLLKQMVGMETVALRIEEIVSHIESVLSSGLKESPCIHMRFVGNPGTGKTTVARVVGKILKERGVLRNGNFFEYGGRDFCGRYIGETSPKTSAMCRDAYGSVLFIDEAYSLYRGGDNDRDFGREALDTLIAEMENHRSDLVVIMAGYPDEMDRLMKGNAGLASRMPYVIEFPNYTREQLCEIFLSMAAKRFSFDESFRAAVREYFDALPDEVLQSKEFSNARFARNLFERTWGKAVFRAQLSKESGNVLLKEDFLQASSEKEFQKCMKKRNKSTLGFL